MGGAADGRRGDGPRGRSTALYSRQGAFVVNIGVQEIFIILVPLLFAALVLGGVVFAVVRLAGRRRKG